MTSTSPVWIVGVFALASLCHACASNDDSPFRGPPAATPHAAALLAFWHGDSITPPTQLLLNIPPDVEIDTVVLRNALTGHVQELLLRRDSALEAAPDVSDDFLAQVDGFYDVRPVRESRWRQLVADTALIRDVPPRERVYEVRRQWCRGWPCLEGAFIELRRRGTHWRGLVFMEWVE